MGAVTKGRKEKCLAFSKWSSWRKRKGHKGKVEKMWNKKKGGSNKTIVSEERKAEKASGEKEKRKRQGKQEKKKKEEDEEKGVEKREYEKEKMWRERGK